MTLKTLEEFELAMDAMSLPMLGIAYYMMYTVLGTLSGLVPFLIVGIIGSVIALLYYEHDAMFMQYPITAAIAGFTAAQGAMLWVSLLVALH